MALQQLSRYHCHGGWQGFYQHAARETKTDMRFAMYLPPAAQKQSVPLICFLSGLTCTEENFPVKSGAQRIAAQLGLALLAPDTSPRGTQVPQDPDKSYDFGLGAGFYLDATESPWAEHYRMYSYLLSELFPLVNENFPVHAARQSIMGHSMGGHGALTIALKNPKRFRAVSAFAPIVAPSQVPWGEKALGRYLGADRTRWRNYDTCALLEDGARVGEILVDQGEGDQFLEQQLKPHRLREACQAAGVPLTLRMQPGYDHGYYFISTFIEDHLRWHAARI
jgi:S-formylglutathione hydrolase